MPGMPMLFLAAAEVVFPVREPGIHCAEGNQDTVAVLAALLRQPEVHGRHVAVQQRVEATGPGLGDAVRSEPA